MRWIGMSRITASLLLLLSLSSVSFAAEIAPAAPVNRVPGPMVLPTAKPGGDTFPAGLFSIKNHFTSASAKLYKGSSRYDYTTPSGAKAGPKRSDMFVNVFKIRYGITDRLEVNTATPFINTDIKNHNADGSWMGGLGDTTILFRYGVKKRSKDSPFAVSLDFGFNVPTGQVGDKEKYLATNAFAANVGGGFSWVDNNQRLDLDGGYTVYTEGAHGIKPGDYALFHAQYSWAVTRNLDIGVEAYYRIDQQGEVHGKGQHDSFSEAYVGPKIMAKVPEFSNLMVGAGVFFPVYRHYDAPELSPDVRYDFTILFAF